VPLNPVEKSAATGGKGVNGGTEGRRTFPAASKGRDSSRKSTMARVLNEGGGKGEKKWKLARSLKAGAVWSRRVDGELTL